ncbi:MAG: redoxin domain-containing protein [Planctomycetota bacterium]|jgi:peroxiredoxin
MGATHVSVGDRAPFFLATTWLGEEIELESYRGRRLWLAFFRFASCPLANLRIHEISKRHDLSADGLRIIAVFPSSRERIAAHVGKQNPPFPLVSDPREELYMLYGLRASVAGLIGRDVGLRTVQARPPRSASSRARRMGRSHVFQATSSSIKEASFATCTAGRMSPITFPSSASWSSSEVGHRRGAFQGMGRAGVGHASDPVVAGAAAVQEQRSRSDSGCQLRLWEKNRRREVA